MVGILTYAEWVQFLDYANRRRQVENSLGRLAEDPLSIGVDPGCLDAPEKIPAGGMESLEFPGARLVLMALREYDPNRSVVMPSKRELLNAPKWLKDRATDLSRDRRFSHIK